MSTKVPPVTDEFVSDAVNTLDPPVTAYDIAELWVDQNAPEQLSDEEFSAAVKKAEADVAYYIH